MSIPFEVLRGPTTAPIPLCPFPVEFPSGFGSPRFGLRLVFGSIFSAAILESFHGEVSFLADRVDRLVGKLEVHVAQGIVQVGLMRNPCESWVPYVGFSVDFVEVVLEKSVPTTTSTMERIQLQTQGGFLRYSWRAACADTEQEAPCWHPNRNARRLKLEMNDVRGFLVSRTIQCPGDVLRLLQVVIYHLYFPSVTLASFYHDSSRVSFLVLRRVSEDSPHDDAGWSSAERVLVP